MTGLVVERRGPVGWLLFDRPAVGNALNGAMLDALEAAWADLDADPAVRAIVNTGNGAAFQTGLDVVELSRNPAALRAQSRRTAKADLRLSAWQCQVAKPVIAAVNGMCAGGGLHFVADADLVLASTDAVFTDPHVSLGQVSAFETIALARRSPMEAALRLALGGRSTRIDAWGAHALGIVGEVVAPDELRARAQAVGETLASCSPSAVAAAKAAAWRALEDPLATAEAHAAAVAAARWSHADAAVGLAAARAGRTPEWAA